MITITNIRNAKNTNPDEIWAIVRSMKKPSPDIKQVQDLSPSWDLFKTFQTLKEHNHWNHNTFREIYVPEFLSGLIENKDKVYPLLNELWRLDKYGKNICLVCFCTDETMCHRSIIAGLLQGVGCNVTTDTGLDYSMYNEIFKKMEK